MFKEMSAQGIEPDPIFSLPGFSLSFIGIDILHCCGLGVTQDLIGNIMWEVVKEKGFIGGSSIEARVATLNTKLKTYYSVVRPLCRVDFLTREMIKPPSKGPKFRAKAAETKGVLPFAVSLALDMSEASPREHYHTIASCASALMDFYVLLDHDEWLADAASETVRRFCLLYKALSAESSDERLWRMKPKMHMLQELVEFQVHDLGHPARYWTFQDESFVGEIAKLAMSRGGPRNVASAAQRTLDRYRALLT